LRALLDAAHINNSQTLLKLKGGRIGGQSDRIEPTQVIEIEGAPGVDDVRKLAMPMPFNQPSSVLLNLLDWLTAAAKGVVSTSEEKIGEANNNMPVGTAQALIEQGAKVFSSIHARMHRSQAKSLAIISRINHWYLNEMDNQSGTEIQIRDFSANNDIRPVSDPNIFSETQRVAQNQALLQMATSAPPGMFDIRAVYRRVLGQLKVPSIDEVLPNPMGAKESNPALENVSMTMGRPAAAYPDQDHISHIKIHLAYAQDPAYGANPVIGPSFSPHALEHIKQHLTLHYLQSMRAYVAQAQGGRDTLELNQEKPLDLEAQQALALASQMVSQDSQQDMAPYIPQIQQLAQKVQEAQQAQQQNIAASDPTAQVILKTQMAETERKAAESQAKLQQSAAKDKMEYELDIANLQRQVAELKAKYETQTQIDANRNATQIALADINNSSRERVAQMGANIQLSQEQERMAYEHAMTALEATNAAEQDIRQHGLEVERNQMADQAALVQQQIAAQQQAQQTGLEHATTMQQADQSNAQALQQLAAQPPKPTGAL
jgi:hypothetical protein